MRLRLVHALPAVMLLLVGTVAGMKLEAYVSKPDTIKQLRKLEDAFLIINQQYVDEVNSTETAEEAIAAMLEGLDPHSTYISADEIQNVQEEFRGSFGGVGIMFEAPAGDTAQVVSTIADGPSEKVGVLAGDRIIGIDDTSAVGFTSLDIQKYLKGPIGSTVEMIVKRPGVKNPISFEITRDRIPLYTVETAFMVDDETGFLRISRFAMTTYDEFIEKVEELQEQGMERLVIDLRGNPGGIMQSAVRMADEMLGGGKTIVYTKSRNAQYNSNERSTAGGAFEEQPVIVLVDEYSASASEILAGALQDHDRALIVGRRTFGKGLVQSQFPLPDGSVLQMTVSRYYTPSGRLIQTPYDYGSRNEYYEEKFSSLNETLFDPSTYKESIPDSLKYETTGGRTVFGGGGILPDFIIAPDTLSGAEIRTGLRKGLDALFVRDWFSSNEVELRDEWTDREEVFMESFTVDEALWQEFLTFATAKLEEAEEDADAFVTGAELAENRVILETRLRAYIARQLYSSTAWWPIILELDDTFQEAMTLWEEASTLAVN